MDAISDEVRLDFSVSFVEFEPDEWMFDPVFLTMHHRPTHTLFCILIPPDATGISQSDVGARLSHVCDGHPVPDAENLTRIGPMAIVAFLHAVEQPPMRGIDLDDDIPF